MAPITTPVTFSIFAKNTRNAGTYNTSTATVPEGVYAIGISDLMTDAVASDPTNSFTLTVAVSLDGVTWLSLFEEEWTGGTFTSKQTGATVPNHINESWSNDQLASGAYTGWSVRATLVQNNRFATGFNITVYPQGFNP